MPLGEKLKRAVLGAPGASRVRRGRVELFGIPFAPLSLPELVDQIFARLSRGERGLVLFAPDAWAVSHAILDPGLAALYREADFVACDGVGTALAARALGTALPRVPGADLARALCKRAAREGLSVYLLGGRPGVAQGAARRLTGELPGLRVAGTHPGYFPGAGPLEEIKAARPDLLLVGMGFPRQERWILRHRGCGAGLLMGVGATLDFWAGRVPRAPLPLRKAGLEWLWRTTVQPKRVLRLWCVPFLLYHILLARLRG